MILTINTGDVPPAFTTRALAAYHVPNRVLLHNGRFWRVVSYRINWRAYVFDLVAVSPVRKSIDDCTPNEWFEATRMPQIDTWRFNTGKEACPPVQRERFVDVRFRCGADATGSDARAAQDWDWTIRGRALDILYWRYAS